MSDHYLLDVNVPMYAAGRHHPYKEPCAWVMTEVARGRLSAAIDAEIVQEILYRYGALQQWGTAVALARNLLTLVPTVYAVSRSDAITAVDLFDQYAPKGVKPRDLIHAAVMRNNGLTGIISTDQHFDLISGLTRRDPLDLFRAAHAG